MHGSCGCRAQLTWMEHGCYRLAQECHHLKFTVTLWQSTPPFPRAGVKGPIPASYSRHFHLLFSGYQLPEALDSLPPPRGWGTVRVEGLLEREQARAQWDLEAERQECSLQPCRQEMELGLAESPAICMWRWERKVVRFDCLRAGGSAVPTPLIWFWWQPSLPSLGGSGPWPASHSITKAVKISSPWASYFQPETELLRGLCCCCWSLDPFSATPDCGSWAGSYVY